MDKDSLTHTKWDCKYHIVFAPKYRRQIIYKQISADIGTIIRTLCNQKGVEIARSNISHAIIWAFGLAKVGISFFWNYAV